MSYNLTEEEQLIQQNAGEFAKEYIEPVAVELDQTGKYPAEIIAKLAEYGMLGVYLPEEYGGADAGYLSYVLAVEEVAKASGAVASIFVNHASLAAYAINRFGTPAQKEAYLPGLCDGTTLGAFAWAEAGGAPGAGEHKVVAEKQGDAYVLSGDKCYVANGGAAGVYLVSAVTEPEQGAAGISLFIVKPDQPGVSITRQIDKMGLKACPTAEIAFRNVKVAAADLLGEQGKGLAIVKEAKAAASIAEGAAVIGIMQAALAEATEYSKTRKQFGKAIATFPAIQTMLADIRANIHLAKFAVYDAAAQIASGEDFALEAAVVKKFLSITGTQALIDAVQVEGGYGFCEDMGVSRFYRDVNGFFLTESSEEFAENIIAEEILQ